MFSNLQLTSAPLGYALFDSLLNSQFECPTGIVSTKYKIRTQYICSYTFSSHVDLTLSVSLEYIHLLNQLVSKSVPTHIFFTAFALILARSTNQASITYKNNNIIM